MQQIRFTTVAGTSVTVNDVNTSYRMAGGSAENLPLHLTYFEGNSAGVTYEQYDRIGYDGAGVYGAKLNPRTIEIELALLPVSGKESDMYELRRRVLSLFPPGQEGILYYFNTSGEQAAINCFVSEYPGFERKVGVLCSTKLYFTAFDPFWRQPATAVSLSCTSDRAGGAITETVFDLATDYPVPAFFTINCDTAITQTPAGLPPAVITLGGRSYPRLYKRLGAWDDINSDDLSPTSDSVYEEKKLYLTGELAAGDKLTLDWGVLNNFYITPDKQNCVDFIRSERQVVQNGENKLKIEINGTGALSLTLRRYRYVKAV